MSPLAPILLLAGLLPQSGSDPREPDLMQLSLEELMQIPVTLASRGSQPLQDTPAAVYVLTGDEIRRAGFTSIPEALRMVPGFQVARFSSFGWDLTARGFSGGFSSDLLVMIDGIEVYTPLFAGVWWELQEILIEDVERIEVVRGPVASLWGANTVNGIVHVITKSAHDTQGTLTSLTAGPEEQRLGYRFGAPLGARGAWRGWMLGTHHEPLVDSSGDPLPEGDWGMVRAGFRGDWTTLNGDRWLVHGNLYSASIGEEYFVASPTPPFSTTVIDSTPKTGLQIFGSWERGDEDDTTRAQVWYTRDNQQQVDLSIAIDTLNLQLMRSLRTGAHKWLFGAGYRLDLSDLEGDFTLTYDPEERARSTFSVFGQDEISLRDNLRLTVGTQMEHNDFTGFEIQPTLRGVWEPRENHVLWSALSRAVRTPSLQENDVRYLIPQGGGNFIELRGSPDLEAERLLGGELGYRFRPAPPLAVDLVAFYNDFDNLQTLEDGTPHSSGGNTFFPLVFDNKAQAESWGVELALDWVLSERWKLRAAYTYFTLESEIDSDSSDLFFSDSDGSTPHNQANLRSYLDLGAGWELDGAVYYVDRRPLFDTDSYIRTDLRVGLRAAPGVRMSLGVQNAFEELHREADPGIYVETNAYFALTVER